MGPYNAMQNTREEIADLTGATIEKAWAATWDDGFEKVRGGVIKLRVRFREGLSVNGSNRGESTNCGKTPRATARASWPTRALSQESEMDEPGRLYEVEVFIGGGGDRDSVATFLVRAITENQAIDEARKAGGAMLNAEACLVRRPEKVNESDYDGFLEAPRRWHYFKGEDRTCCDLCGREADDYEVHIKEMWR